MWVNIYTYILSLVSVYSYQLGTADIYMHVNDCNFRFNAVQIAVIACSNKKPVLLHQPHKLTSFPCLPFNDYKRMEID